MSSISCIPSHIRLPDYNLLLSASESTSLCRFQADRLAAGLLQLGLSPGDRLGIWGPNSSEWFVSRIAAARAGLIAVSINFFINSSHNMRWGTR
jgi:fatty-acyl-CoA synthase